MQGRQSAYRCVYSSDKFRAHELTFVAFDMWILANEGHYNIILKLFIIYLVINHIPGELRSLFCVTTRLQLNDGKVLIHFPTEAEIFLRQCV